MPATAATTVMPATLATPGEGKDEMIKIDPSMFVEKKVENKPDKKADKNKGNPKPKSDSQPNRKNRETSVHRPQPGGLMPVPLMSMNPRTGPSGAVHFSPAPIYTFPGAFPQDHSREFRGDRDYRGEGNFRGSHDHRGRGRGQDRRLRDGLSANISVNLQPPIQPGGYLGPVGYPGDGQGHYVVYREGPPPPGASNYVSSQPPPYDDRF